MSLLFVISSRQDLRDVLSRYFSFAHRQEVHWRAVPPHVRAQGGSWVNFALRELGDWIEGLAAARGGDPALREAIGFLDLEETSFDDLRPVHRDATSAEESWGSAAGLLVLAFPEVHWVLMSEESRQEDRLLIADAHWLTWWANARSRLASIWQLHREGYSPLLDPAGLRELLRKRVTQDSALPAGGSRPVDLPSRRKLAAAIDDEAAYAYFNAYAAYRFGFRANLVCSEAMMDRLFALPRDGAEPPPPCGEEVWLTFEDLFLRFPDGLEREGCHLYRLMDRDRLWHRLPRSTFRVFATVGHQQMVDGTEQDNKLHLTKWQGPTSPWYCPRDHPPRGHRRRFETIYKPYSGLFDLWRRSGLRRELKPFDAAGRCSRPVPAEDAGKDSACLPWRRLWFRDRREAPPGGHSSPGRLHELADRLIARAGRILENVQTVPDAIQGATLATDALEYLGHRTPTTSLAALALKHRLEVAAECMFYGITQKIEVKPRLREIQAEIHSIGRWFRPKTRRESELSASLKLANELVHQFHDRNQFDEEVDCLIWARDLQRRLTLRRSGLYQVVLPLLWYLHFVLRGIGRFATAIALGVLAFAFLFWLLGVGGSPGQSLFYSFISIVGIQAPIDPEKIYPLGPGATMVVCCAAAFGFLNLGIFVSHLYFLISRR